jgi:hypothetical protein
MKDTDALNAAEGELQTLRDGLERYSAEIRSLTMDRSALEMAVADTDVQLKKSQASLLKMRKALDERRAQIAAFEKVRRSRYLWNEKTGMLPVSLFSLIPCKCKDIVVDCLRLESRIHRFSQLPALRTLVYVMA